MLKCLDTFTRRAGLLSHRKRCLLIYDGILTWLLSFCKPLVFFLLSPNIPEFNRDPHHQQQLQHLWGWRSPDFERQRRFHLCCVLGCVLQSLHVSPMQPHLLWALFEDTCKKWPDKYPLPSLQNHHHSCLFPKRWVGGKCNHTFIKIIRFFNHDLSHLCIKINMIKNAALNVLLVNF